MSSTIDRVTVTLHGRVQGVGFRYWTAAEVRAVHPALTGTVRNLPDGDVEVIAEAADRAELEAFVARLHDGPSLARVDTVDTLYENAVAPRFNTFTVI